MISQHCEAVAAYALLMNLLFKLQQKNILSTEEAADLVDDAMHALETGRQEPGAADSETRPRLLPPWKRKLPTANDQAEAFEGARQLLKSLRDEIRRPD